MTKAQQRRLVNWRLKVLRHEREVTQNISRTCRHFGVSRPWFYKWRARYAAHGEAGLCDRPPVPRRSPRATPREVVSKVLYLRQNYHFGPGKIGDYLRRFHRISLATATVHRILQRHGMARLPANQKHRQHTKRWKRYEKQQPGHRLQMDVKFLERIPGTRKRLYQFTAIDDCTRIRVLKIYDACNQVTAIRFADEVIRRLPFRIYVVQTDNGAEFQSKFHWHLGELGIRHVYIRRARRASTARSSGRTEPTTRSSTSCSTRGASATTSGSSTRSCASGRTTTTSIARTAHSVDRRRTNGYWRRGRRSGERSCHRAPENAQVVRSQSPQS